MNRCSNTERVHAEEALTREKTSLNETDKKSLNEQAVLIYMKIQKSKTESEDDIEEEYLEKSIMFGFIVVRIFN